MRGAILYGPRDVGFEERGTPQLSSRPMLSSGSRCDQGLAASLADADDTLAPGGGMSGLIKFFLTLLPRDWTGSKPQLLNKLKLRPLRAPDSGSFGRALQLERGE